MDLNQARKIAPELNGLDDDTAINVIHRTYYPDLSREEVASSMGYKPPEVKQSAGLLRTAADMGIKGAQGVVGLGQSAVGLASLATGGMVGKGMRAIGYDPEATQAMIGEGLSDAQKASDAKVQQAHGFTDTVMASLENPRAIAGAVAESLPSMLASGSIAGAAAKSIAAKAAAPLGGLGTEAGKAAAAKAIEAAGPKLAWMASGAEGGLTAGQIADQGQAAGSDFTTYAPAAVAGGAGTAVIGRAAGKLMGDAETSLFTGAKGIGIQGSMAARIAKGVAGEGVLEEMPQSAQEQAFTNVATGKPVGEGVSQAAASGLVTGGAMGGAMGALQKRNHAAAIEEIKSRYAPDQAMADKLRESGETEAADILNKTLNRRVAKESAGIELGAMAEAAPDLGFHKDPEFATHYEAMRIEGGTPAIAAARAAMWSSYKQIATDAGMNPKAVDAALAAAKDKKLEDVPAYLEKFTKIAQAKGLANDRAMDVLPAIQSVRDDAIQAVTKGLYGKAESEEATNAALDKMHRTAEKELQSLRDFSPEPFNPNVKNTAPATTGQAPDQAAPVEAPKDAGVAAVAEAVPAAPGNAPVEAAGLTENKVGRKDSAQIAQPESVVGDTSSPWASMTPEQRRRTRLEQEIATGMTNNGGVMAKLRPSAIEKRKQELAAMPPKEAAGVKAVSQINKLVAELESLGNTDSQYSGKDYAELVKSADQKTIDNTIGALRTAIAYQKQVNAKTATTPAPVLATGAVVASKDTELADKFKEFAVSNGFTPHELALAAINPQAFNAANHEIVYALEAMNAVKDKTVAEMASAWDRVSKRNAEKAERDTPQVKNAKLSVGDEVTFRGPSVQEGKGVVEAINQDGSIGIRTKDGVYKFAPDAKIAFTKTEEKQPAPKLGQFPPVAAAMIQSGIDAASALRDRVSNVRLGELGEKYETIAFEFDGVTHTAELKGRNRDLVVFADGRESDKGIAVRAILDGDSTVKAKSPQPTQPITGEGVGVAKPTPQTPADAGVSVSGISIEPRADGTLAVSGPVAEIKAKLKAAGIPDKSVMSGKGKVIVGKTQAKKAKAALQQDDTAENAIRKSVDDSPHKTIGSWHPISVTHNGVTQQFLFNIKRIISDGKGPQVIHLKQIKEGRIISSDDKRPLVHFYKLDRSNSFDEEGIPRYADDRDLKQWSDAFNAGLTAPTPAEVIAQQERKDLADEVDEVMAEIQPKAAAPVPAPQPDTPKLTPAEAKSLMAWEDLGQKDGVKTHALTFYESQADKDAKRGRMIVAKVSKGDRSATAWMVDGEDKTFGMLAQAKKLAEEVGMAKAVADGFVQEVNPFAEYDAVAKQYGYEVRPDGMIGRDGKFSGPKMAVQRGRLRVESGAGNLLGSYAATPESIGKFLEAFWYAEKKAVRGAAPAQQEASNPKKLPPFPVDGYRLERYYANGAKVKPLPAKAFSPTEVQAITDWFKSIGWSVTSGSGANGVNATNDVGMTIDDLPEPYTAAQRKKDEAQKAADERAADKQKAQYDYLASNDAGKFVSDMFGDSMNRFNLTALAKVLAGDEKTFGGLFSNRAAEVLAEAGIVAEDREVKDVVKDIKARFDQAQQDAKKPAKAVADGFVEQGDAPMFSRTKAITPAQRAENFARWSDNATLITSAAAETHAFKTGEKIVVEAFHGTARPDRIGGVFDPKRATSGPMAYFTSSPELASNYAISKQDTSLADENQEYANWFKFKPAGARSAVSIDRAWLALTPEQRRTIAGRMPDIRLDDDGNVIYEEDGGDPGSYDYELGRTRTSYDRQGNPLRAAVETWLNSGTLFGEELQFMKVLELAGFPVKDVTPDFPNDAFPGVYKVHVSMKNPLVVGDVPAEVRGALEAAAKADRSRAKPGADMWDKRSHTLRDWWAKFTDPDPSTATYAWTSIPDKVTDILKAHGYDGIVDWSGKGGGHQSPVYVPFASGQVKGEFNRGTYDPTKKDINFSRAPAISRPDSNARNVATQMLVDALTEKWDNAPEVRVVESFKDLPVDATPDTRGLYYRGTVYVVASRVGSKRAVGEVLAHESVAHYGLREMLGQTDWQRFMGNIQLAIKTGNKPLNAIRDEIRSVYVDENGKPNLTPDEEADEIAARVVEKAIDANGEFKPGFAFVKSVYAKIMQFLRDIGLNVQMTHLELQGALINAQRYLEAGQRTAGGGQTVVAASRGDVQAARQDQTQTPEFKRWFGDSKVVDAQGKPLVVYHGTGEDFSVFAGNKLTHYFTPNLDYSYVKNAYKLGKPVREGDTVSLSGGNVMPVFLSLQNPLRTTDTWLIESLRNNPEKVAEIKAQGHDGVIYSKKDDVTKGPSGWGDDRPQIVAFEPNQVKSATGNNGNFDPSNPDIRYARGTNEPMTNNDVVGNQGGRSADDSIPGARAAQQILNAMEQDKSAKYALRVIPGEFDGAIEVGDTLPVSKKWVNGDETDKPLMGTSATRIRTVSEKSVLDALHNLGATGKNGPNGYYFGNRIVLIKGEPIGAGEDVGESIIKNAQVVGIWKKPTKGLSAIQPNEPTAPDSFGAPMAARSESAIDKALKKATVTDLAHQFGNRLADFRGLALQTLGRRQLVDIYTKDLPPLKGYNTMVQQMDADKNESGAEADAIATDWGKLKDERQLAELMHDATLAQIDPSKPYESGDDKNYYDALKHGFETLTPEAKKTFTEARDMYQAHHEKVRQAITERIERSELSPDKRKALLEKMDGEFFKKVKGVYFPLARFGKYVVVVRDANGEAVNVSRAETLNEAEAARKNLLLAFPKSGGFSVGKVLKDKEFNAARDGVGRGFMEDLFQTLDKQGAGEELQDAISQLYLASLPDLSWAKHGIHRKGTPGFSQDARRAFAQNLFHGARYLAKLKYADQLQEKIDQMQEHVAANAENEAYDSVKAQQVVDEMVKRHESMMNPQSNPISTALTSFGFIFHLGLSPASAIVNLSQTALVALPVMGAKWGFGRSSAALLTASKQAAQGKNDITKSLTEPELKAFNEAVRAGTIDVTMAHDLAGIAQGEDSKVSFKMRPAMKWASFLFHHAEKFNRQVTFIAAYRLSKESGKSHDAAYEEATKATYDGHFDYAASNRPRVMQGNVAKVVLLFKQYAQNMIYTLTRQAQQAMAGETEEVRREARRALGGLLVSHAMAAGVFGLPLVGMLLSAASALGGDDDEPWDAKTALQNMLADAIGQKPAEVLAHGLSRLTPWDISGRVGLDKLLLPDIQEGLQGTRAVEAWMSSALGPVAGIAVNFGKGMQTMSDGKYARGLEEILPAVLRAPIKAYRFGTEGNIDKTGVPINDEISAAGVFGQAIGFSPSEARNAQEGRSAIYQADHAIQARRTNLVRQFAQASMAGDENGKTEIRDDIRRFNERNPKVRITPVQLSQSVRNRTRRIAESSSGVYLPKNRRDAAEAGRFAEVE